MVHGELQERVLAVVDLRPGLCVDGAILVHERLRLRHGRLAMDGSGGQRPRAGAGGRVWGGRRRRRGRRRRTHAAGHAARPAVHHAVAVAVAALRLVRLQPVVAALLRKKKKVSA